MRNDGTHFFRTAAEGGPEWDKHQAYDSYKDQGCQLPDPGMVPITNLELSRVIGDLRKENAELHQELLRLRRLIADALELLKS